MTQFLRQWSLGADEQFTQLSFSRQWRITVLLVLPSILLWALAFIALSPPALLAVAYTVMVFIHLLQDRTPAPWFDGFIRLGFIGAAVFLFFGTTLIEMSALTFTLAVVSQAVIMLSLLLIRDLKVTIRHLLTFPAMLLATVMLLPFALCASLRSVVRN